MEYPCKTVSMNQMLVGPMGFVDSLCETCKTIDCTNSIEIKKMSKLGVEKDVKVMMRGRDPYFVIECVGYINA